MKLKEINKIINPNFIKPTKDNIKVGSIVSWFGSSLEYCKVTKIIGDQYYGYWVENLKDINKTGNNMYIVLGSLDGVLD